MKNRLSSIMSILLMLSFICSFAQTNDLNFTLTSDLVNNSGHDVAISSTLTKSGDTFTWVQTNNGNTDTSVFNIVSTSGSWDQTNSSGTLIYSMDDEGYSCSLLLTESESNITATLTYQISEVNQRMYRFNINAITYQ